MKIKIRLLLLLVITGVTSFGVFMPNNAYSSNPDYSEQISSFYKNNMWQLGKGLDTGQSYTYRICDPEAVVPVSAQDYHYFVRGNDDRNQSMCYVVKLDFVNLLSSDEYDDNKNYTNGKKIWVVQAEIRNLVSGNAISKHAIFHIDSVLYSVKSADSTIHPDNIRYGQSIENTLFSISKYALQEAKPLKMGKEWGEITEALSAKANPKMTVLNKIGDVFSTTQNQLNDNRFVQIQKNFSDVYEVGYEIGIINDANAIFSKYLISSDMPFPLNATVYSPVYVNEPTKEYEFELLSYTNDDIIIDTSDKNNDDDKEIIEDVNIDDNDVDTSSTVNNANITTNDTIDDNDKIVDENVIDITNDDTSMENNANSNSSSMTMQTTVVLVGLILFGAGGMYFFMRFMRKKKSYVDINNTKTDAVKTIHFNDEIIIRIKKVNDDMYEEKF